MPFHGPAVHCFNYKVHSILRIICLCPMSSSSFFGHAWRVDCSIMCLCILCRIVISILAFIMKVRIRAKMMNLLSNLIMLEEIHQSEIKIRTKEAWCRHRWLLSLPIKFSIGVDILVTIVSFSIHNLFCWNKSLLQVFLQLEMLSKAPIKY